MMAVRLIIFAINIITMSISNNRINKRVDIILRLTTYMTIVRMVDSSSLFQKNSSCLLVEELSILQVSAHFWDICAGWHVRCTLPIIRTKEALCT